MHGSECGGQSSEQDRVLIKLIYAESQKKKQTIKLANTYYARGF